jgi:competence protein ComEA
MLPTQRIDDAIRAAGGVTAQADRDYINRELNRASYLHDQDKIYIPRNREMPIGPLPTSGISIQPHSVSVNNATVEEIDIIPGVGKTTALKIIQNRPYSNLKELVSKKVVSASTYKKIQKYIHL